MQDKVFVYGSLMRGCHNNPILLGSECLGEYILEAPLRMVSLNVIPGLIAADDGVIRRTYGELYVVEKEIVERLDRLEGHPDFYRRTRFGDMWVYVLSRRWGRVRPYIHPADGIQRWRPPHA